MFSNKVRRFAEINSLEGGVVNGNVYGGGSWDTYSTRTLGDTEIHLTGGTINGSVYAAGDRDIVEGSTHVYFSGTGTALSEGSIVSGGGINGAEVQGRRYIHIGEPELSDYTVTLLGDGWATEDLPTELVFLNSLARRLPPAISSLLHPPCPGSPASPFQPPSRSRPQPRFPCWLSPAWPCAAVVAKGGCGAPCEGMMKAIREP